MSTSDPTGTPWLTREIDLTVIAYFDMFRKEQKGEPYTKLHKNKELQEQIGRTHKAIEYKHRNISAVLQFLAMDWIPGYKPGANYQNALIAGVERYLTAHPDISMLPNLPMEKLKPLEQTYLIPEPAPTLTPSESSEPKALARLARKFDPASQDARNRELGKLGEERILLSERTHLIDVGREDLAKQVEWTSEERGDGAGYDIRSFSESGHERLLEVKTTTSWNRHTSFYLTENERLCSIEQPDKFRLVRLYDFKQAPKVFELVPPLEEAVRLQPTAYQASFNTEK